MIRVCITRGESLVLLAVALLTLAPTTPLRADDAELKRKAQEQNRELAAAIKEHGPHHRTVQLARRRLGDTLLKLALPKKALKLYLPAEQTLANSSDPTDTTLVYLRCGIVDAYQAMGKPEKGLSFLRKRMAPLLESAGEAKLDPQSAKKLVGARELYGSALHGLAAYEEALEFYQGAHRLSTMVSGAEDAETLRLGIGLGACLIETGKNEEATAILEPLLATLEKRFPEKTQSIAIVRGNLGSALLTSGKADQALQIFEAQLAVMASLFVN